MNPYESLLQPPPPSTPPPSPPPQPPSSPSPSPALAPPPTPTPPPQPTHPYNTGNPPVFLPPQNTPVELPNANVEDDSWKEVSDEEVEALRVYVSDILNLTCFYLYQNPYPPHLPRPEFDYQYSRALVMLLKKWKLWGVVEGGIESPEIMVLLLTFQIVGPWFMQRFTPFPGLTPTPVEHIPQNEPQPQNDTTNTKEEDTNTKEDTKPRLTVFDLNIRGGKGV